MSSSVLLPELPKLLLRLRPNSWRLALFEKLHLDHVRVAADGSALYVPLFVAAGAVHRDDDPLAAGRADVAALVGGTLPATLAPLGLHARIIRLAATFAACPIFSPRASLPARAATVGPARAPPA